MGEDEIACPLCRNEVTRRTFLRAAGTAAASLALPLWGQAPSDKGQTPANKGQAPKGGAAVPLPGVPIVDCHQHCLYSGRSDEKLLLHQRNNGVRTTILMPSGTPGAPGNVCAGNEYVAAFARDHADRFAHYVSVNTARQDAVAVLETWLKAGAVGIGEIKDQVACDSPGMIRAAEVAREFDVPMHLHFQDSSPVEKANAFLDGYTRFHAVIERFPTVRFIGHSKTFWAYTDRNYRPEQGYAPRGAVEPGGLTDRWLSDYPNFYGDLASAAGIGFLARDTEHAKAFLARHQDKLLYGSDCGCATGVGPTCIGADLQEMLNQLCPSVDIRNKVLHGNIRRIVRFAPAQLA
jgi:predicted TIM-barrel fold metal-dependent hydrolase